MIYVCLLLVLLNASSAIAIYYNKKIEETIFLAIAGMVLLLFLSGVVLSLEVGFYTILLLNVGLLLFNIKSIYKQKKLLKDNILTVGAYFSMALGG
jgi:hypothetical protein